MSVSLYDLLDVAEDATPAEIRAAWKAAIADLDPTDRRFRAYNDAAGVLLDPDKRAAYDAELAAGRDEAPAEDTTVEPVAPAQTADVAEHEDVEELEDVGETGAEEAEEADPDEPAESTSTGPRWLLPVLAVLAALSAALLIAVALLPGSLGGTSPADREERAQTAETTAVSAAEAAVPVVLSYDYRTLEADFAEAEDYLTDDFAEKRNELFEQEATSGMTLREQVVADKVVVTARVSGSGLTRVSEDGNRATVVIFVDQDSQKGKAAPRPLRMWATLSMVLEDDEWLLDDICTETDCG